MEPNRDIRYTSGRTDNCDRNISRWIAVTYIRVFTRYDFRPNNLVSLLWGVITHKVLNGIRVERDPAFFARGVPLQAGGGEEICSARTRLRSLVDTHVRGRVPVHLLRCS